MVTKWHTLLPISAVTATYHASAVRLGRNGSKKTEKREGIMEREVKPRSADEERRAGGKAGIDHRFGEIGISAVVAAVRYHGDRQDEQPAQSDFALSFDRD